MLMMESTLPRHGLTCTALLMLSACGGAGPSDPIAWLSSNAIRVQSIDPAQTDFTDLQPLREAIGDARIVLLGEQTHGDGNVFLTKTRLIKFLHQEMGFDVLAFESGMYDMRKSWEAMLDGQDPAEAFGMGAFGIWSGSAEVDPLVAYVAETAGTDRPLELAGFDSQFTDGLEGVFLPELEAFLEDKGSPLLADERWSDFRQVFSAVLAGGDEPVLEDQTHVIQILAELVEWLRGDDTAPAGSDRRFWAQMVRSLLVQAEGSWAVDYENFSMEMANYRDDQMAENLLWMADDWYRGRKIVVWAATYHNLYNRRTIRNLDTLSSAMDYSSVVTMGEHLKTALGDGVYGLAFTAYEGDYGRWLFPEPTPIEAPTAGSLEDLMARAGLRNAIIDFRGAGPALAWLSAPLIARPMGYVEAESDWTSQTDGIFFNRVMTRSTPGAYACLFLRRAAERRGRELEWMRTTGAWAGCPAAETDDEVR